MPHHSQNAPQPARDGQRLVSRETPALTLAAMLEAAIRRGMDAPKIPGAGERYSWAPANPVEYVNHETDDQGFPLCRCDACRELSIRRNAMEVARMFGGVLKEGHDERAERMDREQDYPKGMKA